MQSACLKVTKVTWFDGSRRAQIALLPSIVGVVACILPLPSPFSSPRILGNNEHDRCRSKVLSRKRKRKSSLAFLRLNARFTIDAILLHPSHSYTRTTTQQTLPRIPWRRVVSSPAFTSSLSHPPLTFSLIIGSHKRPMVGHGTRRRTPSQLQRYYTDTLLYFTFYIYFFSTFLFRLFP